MNQATIEVKALNGEVLGRCVIDKNTDPWTLKEITPGWFVETWDGEHVIPVKIRTAGDPVRRLVRLHYAGLQTSVQNELQRIRERQQRIRTAGQLANLRGRRN